MAGDNDEALKWYLRSVDMPEHDRGLLEAEQSRGSFLEDKFPGSPVNRLALDKLRNRQSPG